MMSSVSRPNGSTAWVLTLPPIFQSRSLLRDRLWSAKIQRRSRGIGQEGVLVVKSIQYGVRHHSTCSVETMPLALERHGEITSDREGRAPMKSVVGRDCNALAKHPEFFADAAQIGMIQSRHSRRRVPISLSQSEFACGLRTGVLMTSRPMCATEASSWVE